MAIFDIERSHDAIFSGNHTAAVGGASVRQANSIHPEHLSDITGVDSRVIHALLVVNGRLADKRTDKIVNAMKNK